MEPPILHYLTTGLIAWALLGLMAAVAGLYWQPKADPDWWRGFWFMNAIWAFIDGAIGWSNLLAPAVTMEFLRNVLAINSGLDVAYIASGAFLAMRFTSPLVRGFGWAVILQGAFLLVFDLSFLALAMRQG
ncbi:MAG: DUF6992 family protein [Planctomycetota bacterium]